MTLTQAYSLISQQTPPIIYLSGKSATGKSTFGRKLRDDLGYRVIELEAVLLEVIQEHNLDERSTFHKVFFAPEDSPEKTLFLEATDQVITHAVANSQPVVIEGAVANIDTLRRILQPATDLLFLYLHPADIDAYTRNLTSRFMQSSKDSTGGLSRKFWELIDNQQFDTFCQTHKLTEELMHSIKQYAQLSQSESTARLRESRQKFDSIIVVDIQ